MERRDFLKISAVTGATVALDSCGKPEQHLIRFIPEEDLVPGIAVWKPSVCTLCPAGCGLMVRAMEGDAEVFRNGQLGVIKMGLAKKLEGNPHHPVSRGKLCPRGQAGLQITYHPDRLKNPLRRSGPRGSGHFQEVSWEEALKELVSQLASLRSTKQTRSLVFLTRPWRGQRRELVERFLNVFGARASITFVLFDEAVLRRANFWSFGQPQMPTYDLARSNYVISFGADFLGTWNSPVAHAIAYGEMRQGRPGVRGKLVQVEARMSQTGANADEWVPVRPGTEGLLALGLAHVILNEKLRPVAAGRAGVLIEGWSKGLPDYSPQEVARKTGVSAERITRLARELANHTPAVAIVGGPPLAQSNGLITALAVNALNTLLDSVGKPGGVYFSPAPPLPQGRYFRTEANAPGNVESVLELVQPLLHGRPDAAKVLLVYDANPVFAMPTTYRVCEALEKVPFIASFGNFIDETSILADLILPDHSFLESWGDDIPESGTTAMVASLAQPAMRPLYNTRAMPDVLLDVAHRLGGDVSKLLPWKTYEEMLRAAFDRLREHESSNTSSGPEEFWKQVQEQGGWWSSEGKIASLPRTEARSRSTIEFMEPEFDGPEKDFPFHFLPFASQAFLDGSLAHLPWMQEMPDVLSTVMWGTWVEINSKTAERLNIRQGDQVEVASRHGKIQAPALISPGIAPDVIAMPVGQGHEHYGRYASRRGANPISILAPMIERETKSLAWAATRVNVTLVGEGRLALFAGGLRRFPHEQEHR